MQGQGNGVEGGIPSGEQVLTDLKGQSKSWHVDCDCYFVLLCFKAPVPRVCQSQRSALVLSHHSDHTQPHMHHYGAYPDTCDQTSDTLLLSFDHQLLGPLAQGLAIFYDQVCVVGV